MKIIMILSSILIFTSCLQPSSKSEENVYKIDIDIAQETYFQSVFDSISYVQLESVEGNEIGHINKILYDKNKYIINDIQTGTIFIFDQKGKFHSKIEASGNGPGEYAQVTDICVDPLTGNIKVMDAMQEKIITFDINGKFMRETSLPVHPAPLHFYQITEDIYAFDFQRCSNEKEWRYNLCLATENFSKEIHKFLPYDKPLGVSFSPRITLFKTNDEIVYIPLYSSTIYTVSSKNITPRYKLDFGDKWINQDFIDIEWKDALEFMNKLGSMKYIYYFNLLETDSFIYSDFMYKEHQYHLIINKNNNHIFLQKDTDKFQCNYTGTPMGCIGNKLIIPLTPIEYNAMIIEKQNSISKTNLLPEEGNPILMHITFKEF